MTTTLVRPLPRDPATPSDTRPSDRRTPDLIAAIAQGADAAMNAARERLMVSIRTDLEPWLQYLEADDRDLFWREVLSAPSDELERIIRDWLTTAEALRDPLARETLLGNVEPSDFIEVQRP